MIRVHNNWQAINVHGNIMDILSTNRSNFSEPSYAKGEGAYKLVSQG